MPTLAELKAALTDPEYYKMVGGGLLDAYNRGAVGGLLGAPVDMANSVINAGKMATGYLGHKAGLLNADQMPQLDMMPVGGSEWIGQKMQDAGMVSGNRNIPAEMIAGVAGVPLTALAAQRVMPKVEAGLSQMAKNAQAKGDMNVPQYAGQRGAARSGLLDTAGLENRGRELVRQKANELAQTLIGKGFKVDVTHSGSTAGPSSYLKIHDPETGRFFQKDVRISGHSKGVKGTESVWNVSDEQFPMVVKEAENMRHRGPTELVKSNIENETNAIAKRMLSAEKKLSKGKLLTKSEQEAVDNINKLFL